MVNLWRNVATGRAERKKKKKRFSTTSGVCIQLLQQDSTGEEWRHLRPNSPQSKGEYFHVLELCGQHYQAAQLTAGVFSASASSCPQADPEQLGGPGWELCFSWPENCPLCFNLKVWMPSSGPLYCYFTCFAGKVFLNTSNVSTLENTSLTSLHIIILCFSDPIDGFSGNFKK